MRLLGLASAYLGPALEPEPEFDGGRASDHGYALVFCEDISDVLLFC